MAAVHLRVRAMLVLCMGPQCVLPFLCLPLLSPALLLFGLSPDLFALVYAAAVRRTLP
jgi:hypothetical protein